MTCVVISPMYMRLNTNYVPKNKHLFLDNLCLSFLHHTSKLRPQELYNTGDMFGAKLVDKLALYYLLC